MLGRINHNVTTQERPCGSLYAQYVSEREGKQVLETEQGFATYLFTNDGCYIEDIFVHKDYRETGLAAMLADQIAEIAKDKGFKRLYGSVVPAAKGSTISLKVLLAYGFKLDSSSNNFILLSKEIE